MTEKSKKNPYAYEPRCAWDLMEEPERQEALAFSEGYKVFLDGAKTERKGVALLTEQARQAGFRPLEEYLAEGRTLKPGDRVMAVNRDKNVFLAVIGQRPLEEGLRILGAHLDSPRLDLKPNPLYEEGHLGWLKTHYYGGIKKYQWTAIPLALHGVVFGSKGEKIEVTLGEAAADPVLTITDLLPHLAKDQMDKKLREGVPGEGLNLLVGSLPVGDKEVKERVKEALLNHLHGAYGLIEEDFLSAELEAVPAGPSRDVGLDRSMVGGYGQDDRVCSYGAFRALLDQQVPYRTAVALLVDKEEIGSQGNTGMQSRFLANTVAELCYLEGGSQPERAARRALERSRALSADVNAAQDPNWEGVLEKRNAARLGYGVVMTKYTGSGGKYDASDANAEFVSEVRQIFNREGLAWQTGELGKVDQGGGGTVAQFLAAYGMDVLDCGVALLSMHAPFEIASKADIWMAYRGYGAFLAAEG